MKHCMLLALLEQTPDFVVHSCIFKFWRVVITIAGHNSGVLVLREGSVLTWVIDSVGIFISDCEFY